MTQSLPSKKQKYLFQRFQTGGILTCQGTNPRVLLLYMWGAPWSIFNSHNNKQNMLQEKYSPDKISHGWLEADQTGIWGSLLATYMDNWNRSWKTPLMNTLQVHCIWRISNWVQCYLYIMIGTFNISLSNKLHWVEKDILRSYKYTLDSTSTRSPCHIHSIYFIS